MNGTNQAPGGGDDVLSGRNGFVTGHTAARSSTEERLLSGLEIPEITSPCPSEERQAEAKFELRTLKILALKIKLT